MIEELEGEGMSKFESFDRAQDRVFGWRNGSVLPVVVGEKFCDLILPLLEKKYLKTIYNFRSCRVMLGCVEVLPPSQATGLNKSSRGNGRAKHLS